MTTTMTTEIATIRADMRRLEKAISQAADEEEANLLKNFLTSHAIRLDEALSAEEAENQH